MIVTMLASAQTVSITSLSQQELNLVSQPKLSDTDQHPMWEACDLAVDICLSQVGCKLTHHLYIVAS